jgi:hypothetical protein
MADDFTIQSDFTKEDYRTILEALDDWEFKDVELLNMIQKLKHLEDPPEGSCPDDFRESFMSFRQHMLSQEADAKQRREIRREKSTLLKAKIILMNQRKAAEKALEDASSGRGASDKNSPPWLSGGKKKKDEC